MRRLAWLALFTGVAIYVVQWACRRAGNPLQPRSFWFGVAAVAVGGFLFGMLNWVLDLITSPWHPQKVVHTTNKTPAQIVLEALMAFMSLAALAAVVLGAIWLYRSSEADSVDAQRRATEVTLPHTPTPPAPIESTLATPVSPVATPGSLPAPSEASDAVLPPGVAIVLRRSGGLEGRGDQWTIYNDGRVLSGDGTSWNAAPERIGALIAQLDEVGFFSLRGSYVPEDTCCDRFLYELVVAGGARTHSIMVLEAERAIPPGAWQAVDAVNAFIAETSKE